MVPAKLEHRANEGKYNQTAAWKSKHANTQAPSSLWTGVVLRIPIGVLL
jgi:hypothetical protein